MNYQAFEEALRNNNRVEHWTDPFKEWNNPTASWNTYQEQSTKEIVKELSKDYKISFDNAKEGSISYIGNTIDITADAVSVGTSMATLADRVQELEESFKKFNDNKGDTNMAYTTTSTTGTINYYGDGAKENSPMEKMFNFDFGPLADNTAIRMSMCGLAVKNSSGTWVTYDAENGCIMDAELFNFPKMNKFLYKMPVAIHDVKVGDIIIHARKPMFVVKVSSTNTKLTVVDPYAGEEKIIMPTRSPFGFNFVTKIVSMFNFQNMMAGASADNPFGAMLPMMLLMGDNKEFDPMMWMFMAGGQNPFANFFNFGKTNPTCDCENTDK